MKKLIITLLLGVLSLSSYANNIVIGTGSGSVSVTGMSYNGTTINSGDVLVIDGGTYSSITLTNLNHVTIVNSGLVNCTGAVNIGPWSYVNMMGNGTSGVPYGFNFTYSGQVFQIGSGHIADHSSIQYFQTNGSGDLIDFSGSQGGTWTLTDSSTLMFNQLTLANFSMNNSAHILYGTWDATTTFHSSAFGLQIYNAQIQNMTTGDGLIFGYNIWNYNFHDWTISGTNSSASDDIGMIRVAGYGSVSSVIMNGTSLWGYVARLESISINGVGTTYVYNNLKMNTTCYGVVDIRASSSNIGGSATSANAYICNNTQIGNLDPISYTTAAAVIFGHPGATYYVYNNLNTGSQDAGTNDVYNAASDPVVSSNNLVSATSAGVLDPTTGKLVAGSPAINAGIALSWRTQDLYHNPATLDLGAISYGTPTTTPPSVNDTTVATSAAANDSTGRIKFTWSATREGNDSLWVIDSSSNNSNWVRYTTVASKAAKGTSSTTVSYGPVYYFFTPTTAAVTVTNLSFGMLCLGMSFKNRKRLFGALTIAMLFAVSSCSKENMSADMNTSVDAKRTKTTAHNHYFRLSVIHKDKTITYFNTENITLTY